MAIAFFIGLLVPLSACTTGVRSKDAENEPGPYPSWVDLATIDAAQGYWEKEISTKDDEMILDLYGLNNVSEARQCEFKYPYLTGKFDVKGSCNLLSVNSGNPVAAAVFKT
jgi:hypothetical protein